MANQATIYCSRHKSYLRLVGDFLVCRKDSGRLVWRLTREETTEFLTAARSLVQQPGWTGSCTSGRLRLGRVGNRDGEHYIVVDSGDGTSNRIQLGSSEIDMLVAATLVTGDLKVVYAGA